MNKSFILKGVIGDRIYTGCGYYHDSHQETHNTMNAGGTSKYPYCVGVELEVECNNIECQEWLKEVPSNWFYRERDGSLSSSKYGMEIITIPMNPKVAYKEKTWFDLCDALKNLGATSHDNNRCGLHVHISKTAFGATEEERDETISKLIYMYHYQLSSPSNHLILKVMRRGYSDYCGNIIRGLDSKKRSYFEFVKDNGVNAVDKKYRKDVVKGISKPQRERYDAINKQNQYTIEFRQGRGTLNSKSLCTTIEFCCVLTEFCRVTKAENCTMENFMNKVKKLPKSSCLRNKLFNEGER